MDKIQVIEPQSNELLKEFEMAESEQAYAYAQELEEMGIEVLVIKPSILKTLSSSLGLNTEDQDLLFSSAAQEIDDHCEDDSCAVRPVKTTH